ncbi:MAG: extracellular solute-binding protein [Haloplanus sp.]
MGTRRVGRRQFCVGAAVALGGVAGCARSNAASGRSVFMLVAGSLNNAFEHGLRQAVDAPLEIEAHGSAAVARFVAAGTKDPDIVSVADTALFESPLDPSWYADFATNAVVVAYNPDTAGGRRVAAAGRDGWYRPLRTDGVSFGRTDPDLDPLGYRTLFVLDLATDYYDTEVDLRATIPRRTQIYPETQLISQFETGAIDAAITYRSMAVERGYDYVDLPPTVDLSDPAFADRYASVGYELPSGRVVHGGPISYGSTARRQSPTVRDVFDRQISGRYLDAFGFGVPDDYPRFTGDVPQTITN